MQFIKELDQLDEKNWQFAKLLRRFADWELFQRERLERSIGGRSRLEALKVFGAWKGLVKDAFARPPKKDGSMTMTDRRLLFWIQSTSMDRLLATMPVFPIYKSRSYMEGARLIVSAALRYAPDKLPMVLECVLRVQRRVGYTSYYFFIYEDVLHLLATKLRRMKPDEKQTNAEKLADLVVYALEGLGTNVARGGIQISQATIHSILDALPADAVEPWYRQLRAADCNLHPFTQLHFASRIAKSSPSNRLSSVHILRDLRRTGLFQINSPVAASVCTSILTFSKKDLATFDGQSATPADLFRYLHNIGMVPNVITYSAIIRGLCLKKDLQTALDIFDIMSHHGVQPDAFTYSILINGCTLCRDFKLLPKLAIEVCNKGIRDPVVWNGILHAVYICCTQATRGRREPRRTAIYAMNDVYSRIFDVTVLKPFITGRLAELAGELLVQQRWVPEDLQPMGNIPPLPRNEVIRPGSDTLAIMLLGLIRSFAMPYEVVTFYSHFREMLRLGHPAATQLVRERGTFVHDIVLRNLLRWRGTLRIALDIIRDMMGDIKKDADSNTSQDAPMPTAEAWPHGQAVNADAEAPSANANEDVADSHGSTAYTRASGSVGTGDGTGTFIERATAVAEVSTCSTDMPQSEAHVPHTDGNPASEPSRVQHPTPGVYTWSILVYGFMRHKLPREAERILTLMREHGVKPNASTYNTLAAGYAKMQKIPQAVKAMQRLEAEGFQADDWTLRAFSYIGNKHRAIQLMEATVEENKLKKKLAELQPQSAGATDAEAVAEELQEAEVALDGQEDEGQGDEDEDEMLDQDLEARLSQIDPGEIPDHVSRKIDRTLDKLKKIAPVRERNEFKAWARVREKGLSELEEWARVRNLGLSALSLPEEED